MSKRKLVVVEGFVLQDQCDSIIESSTEFMGYEDNLYHMLDDIAESIKGTGLKVFYMCKRTDYTKFRRKEAIIAVGYPIFEGNGSLAEGQLYSVVSNEISEQTEGELKGVRDRLKLSKLDAKTFVLDGRMLGEDDPIDWQDR